jgi:hypothetical protein
VNGTSGKEYPGQPERSRGDRGWFEPPAAVSEPTQSLPTISARPSPLVVARAVIVYQERPRRPWVLWVFTVALVALTIGVVLGQTAAFEPVYRSPRGQTAAADVIPSAPAAQPWPDAEHRVTAPLGKTRKRVLEVTGASTVLRVRSADLGDNLFDIATTDRGAVPSVTDSARGTRLELIRTAEAGTVGAEIQLNAKVAWTLKLAGGTTEHIIDLQAGGAARIEVTGGTAQLVLQLPEPKGTVPIKVNGKIGELIVRTRAPLRLRLAGGAQTAVVDGKAGRKLKAGTKLTAPGWSTAKNRYDVTATGAVVTATTGE